MPSPGDLAEGLFWSAYFKSYQRHLNVIRAPARPVQE